MEQLVLLSLQVLYWNRLKSYSTKVLIILSLGLHPLKISDGFDIAVDIAVKKLEAISE